MTAENQKKHDEKKKRMTDALSLKVPDRVPIEITGGQFMITNAGFTMADVIYDTTLEKAKFAIKKYLNDFDPDVVTDLGLSYFGEGPGHEMQGSKTMLIAGMDDPRIGKDSIQQYIEFPTLLDDEFDEFFNDRMAWSLNKFLPRVSSVMEPFEGFRVSLNHRGIADVAGAFSRPEMRTAIQRLWAITDFYADFKVKAAAVNREFSEMGFPSFGGGGVGVVPFDKYSDTFRGTILSLMDLYDHTEEVERYLEEFQRDMLRAIRAANKDGSKNGKYTSLMLHKGIDNFMNDTQYRRFYWKHLKEIIETIAECGMIPCIFCEGKYMSRLDCLAEVPKGTAYYFFEDMNMAETKRRLSGIACVGGGFPSALLEYGTKQKVIDEVKRLLDACAPGGGYIFKLSAGLNTAKPENVEAMFDTVKTYGKY
jgi:hypothetical protein